jgi:hypothetical protein
MPFVRFLAHFYFLILHLILYGTLPQYCTTPVRDPQHCSNIYFYICLGMGEVSFSFKTPYFEIAFIIIMIFYNWVVSDFVWRVVLDVAFISCGTRSYFTWSGCLFIEMSFWHLPYRLCAFGALVPSRLRRVILFGT